MNKAQRYYSLYYSKKNGELKIKLLKNPKDTFYLYAERNCNSESPLYRYNDCYYLSSDRKELKKYAEALKNKWIESAKNELALLEGIKI